MRRWTIGFTGHRDCTVASFRLYALAEEYPGALWIQGGAAGFDIQVWAYAETHDIETWTWRPDYKNLPPKIAPIVRDFNLVDWRPDFLVACWDGRKWGGTYRTRDYALRRGVPVRDWPPKNKDKDDF